MPAFHFPELLGGLSLIFRDAVKKMEYVGGICIKSIQKSFVLNRAELFVKFVMEFKKKVVYVKYLCTSGISLNDMYHFVR